MIIIFQTINLTYTKENYYFAIKDINLLQNQTKISFQHQQRELVLTYPISILILKNITQVVIMEEQTNIPEVVVEEQEDHTFFHYKEIKHYLNIPPNTIDDGVTQSLWRQFSSMAFKFSYVICPRSKGAQRLRNWDLWGPFFMCCVLGLFINDATQFLILFGVVFVGAIVVTFNTRILGGKISIFQSISILGYCIFPLFLVTVVMKILAIVGWKHIIVKIGLALLAAVWGVMSAQNFVAHNISEDKKIVCLYPILIFYLFIGLMTLYI